MELSARQSQADSSARRDGMDKKGGHIVSSLTSSTSIRHQHRLLRQAQAAMPAVASLPAPPAAAQRRRFSPVASASLRRVASGGGSSWRSERRLMSELERTVTAGAAERVIRSYVGTKSERAALAALSRLLMDSDPLAIPVRPLSQLNPSHLKEASRTKKASSFLKFYPCHYNL